MNARLLKEQAQKSLEEAQQQAALLLRVNKELSAAIEVAPRSELGVITSLTLSREAIDVLKSLASAEADSMSFLGIKIYLKDTH